MEKPTPENELKQKYYNYAQICLYHLMRMEGQVEDETDYCARIAPIIEMIRNGVLFCSNESIEKTRERVEKVVKK